MKTQSKILIFTGLLLLGGLAFSCFLFDRMLEPRPPLPISNILREELCKKLDDSRTEAICITDDAVLASDTVGSFEKKFPLHITTQDDIADLLGPARLEEVTPFNISPSYYQYDLAGTGVNRIVIWRNHELIVRSVVFIRADVLTPLSQDTVADLCNRLDLTGSKPCTDTGVIYAQDFFPFIRDKFLDKPVDVKLYLKLLPYVYREPQCYYKLFFRYKDNVGSRLLFYFDETKKLENIVFVGGFLPTPLDPEVLTDLCQRLRIDAENDKCEPGTQTYTRDLAGEIRAAFPVGEATYEDVQDALAKYQYRFDYPVRDALGKEVTLSWYDFVGNNYTRIRFDFDNNFILRQITFFSGGS